MSRLRHRSLAILALLAALTGCSYEEPEASAARTSNTCSFDEDCGPDARCASSMCVAREVDDTLRVVLDVTPLQQADGAAPVSMTLDSFKVEAGMTMRSWELPEPVRVRGRIRNGDTVVDADLTLSATQLMPGIPPKTVMASVVSTVSENAPEYDFDVSVADEGEYTLRVTPKDTSLPPIQQTVTVRRGKLLDTIDYAEHDVQRTLKLEGETEERTLVVRAFDIATGALISSSAPVVNSRATLRFAEEPEAFRIVIRPEGAYDPEGVSSVEACDHDTPVLPTFAINSTDLDLDAEEEGVLTLELPPAPARIRYEGEIVICDAPSLDGATVPPSLPVTFRSTSVALGDEAGAWTAEVATDTAAALEAMSNDTYYYCLDVFEGDYQIVVTPPESKPCEIFAQSFPIAAPEGKDEHIGPEIRMQDAAQLLGQLTADQMPLVATTVDVQSLGRPIDLGDNDAALTTFSRSRQTTTDETGAFSLAVDRGSYDVTLRPPAGSGYAWYVRRDVTIGSRSEFPNFIDMSSPLAVDCDIHYRDGATLEGAEITAYAIIVDDQAVERAIPVGKTTADADGHFMLLLPSAIDAGW